MKTLQQLIRAQDPEQSHLGILHYSGMYEPTWAHPRAEIYFFYFNLHLSGREGTKNRFFTEHWTTSKSGEFLAIEEYDTDGTPDSFDRSDVRLVVVSITRAEEAVICRQNHGRIRPVRFEGTSIVYEKTTLKQRGVVHHFDSSIADLTWRPLLPS